MALNRRNFLRNILQGSAVAVASAAAVKLEYVPEIKAAALEELEQLEQTPRDELLESIKKAAGWVPESEADRKIIIGAPKQVFNPNARVWMSVAREANAWADYISEKSGVQKASVLAACKTLARACDRDLRDAEVTADSKIVVDLPKITRTWTGRNGEKQVEIAMGVEKQAILGHERIRVGYIGKKAVEAPRLVDAKGYDTIDAIERKRAEVERLSAEIAALEAA